MMLPGWTRARGVLLVVVLLATTCTTAEPEPPLGDTTTGIARTPTVGPIPTDPSDRVPAPRIPVIEARVSRVIDGDTIEVRIGSLRERVRLIGIDTPERGQRYADEATAFTRARVGPGSRVFLEMDVEERDRFGRLLAYVWRERPASRALAEVRRAMHNAAVLSAGLAVVLTIAPNVTYADTFTSLQRTAREQRRGMWAPRATSARCDPSYPDVCIPPPPPDLDCGDVDHRRFRVRGADPHRFDGDGNGRGCER